MAHITLASGRRRALALLLGLGVLGSGALGIVHWLQAARAAAVPDKAGLEGALRVAADDARLHHRLGQWEQFSLAEGDVQRVLAHYRRATELNPYESAYWLDLADALLQAGDSPAARAAAEKALQVDPRTPDTLWRVANFWLRTSEPARAFPYLRAVLETRPALAPLVVQAAHRTFGDPEVLLREVLPPEPQFLLAYLGQLLREGDTPAAARLWQELVRLGKPFDAQPVLPYVDFLLRTRRLAEAVKVWTDLETLGLLPGNRAADGERLFNSDLRQPVLNGGFDWRVEPAPRVSVTLGAGRRADGPPALIIRFSGENNLRYRHFYQYVVVEPNRRYRFRAWLSTEGITTESGPRLEVADVYDGGRVLERSPSTVGTTDWAPEELEFVTGPETRLLRVGIVRLPSQRVSNRIRGSVRAAEFSVRAVGGL